MCCGSSIPPGLIFILAAQAIIVLAAALAIAQLPDETRYDLVTGVAMPLLGPRDSTNILQLIDGHYYFPPRLMPRKNIKQARAVTWGADDLVLAVYPRSGMHLLQLTSLLVLLRGELPSKTDLHTLLYTAEFDHAAYNARSLREPQTTWPTLPRLVCTHMPPTQRLPHHLQYTEGAARYVTVIRDPVDTMSSLRRIDQLLFGHMVSAQDHFISWHLDVRHTGWLEYALGWWALRNRSNVLLLRFEHMLQDSQAAVRRIANFSNKALSEVEIATVVRKMDKQWSLENVDPYHFRASTPLSPPGTDKASNSNFIVDSSELPPEYFDRFSSEQRTEIRRSYL